MKVRIVKKDNKLYPVQEDGNNLYLGSSISTINDLYSIGKSIFRDKEEINTDQFKEVIPVNPSKILCPALNFGAHSRETNQKVSDFPYFFAKYTNAITGWNSPIKNHKSIKKLDYEGEIAAIIGKTAYDIAEKDSPNYISGFAVVNDVSARDYQAEYAANLGKNWIMAKTADTFLPVSNSIYLGQEMNFNIITEVNGETRQNGNTDDMIYTFNKMVSYISQNITLYPGDMILSGTPEGVANSGKYPFLKKGDVVKIRSDKIGYLENRIA